MLRLVQLARGSKELIHSGITATATSVAKKSNGHNAIIIGVDFTAGAGTWTIKLQGKMYGSGTFIDMYDSNGLAMAMSSLTADKMQLFVGIPDDFKIVATEVDGTATISVAYELISV